MLELGARGIGHIRHLTEVAPLRIAAVLNVGTAHLGEFGSREAIAQAKGELIEGLPPDGVAVLNADDALVSAMAPRTRARVVTFGTAAHADVRAEDVVLDDLGRPGFMLHADGAAVPVQLHLVGAHHVSNASAAAAVALATGMDLPAVGVALGAARAASRWRMEVTERPDGVVVINDAYNANPESMRAALDALVTIAGRRGARAVAVLGQMAELGAGERAEHEALGRLAARAPITRVIAVGEAARPILDGAALEGSWNGEVDWVPDAPAATEALREQLRPGDVVLVKASRAAGLEHVGEVVAGDRDRPASWRRHNGRDRGRRQRVGVKTILIAAVVGLVTSILVTPLAVAYFRRRGFGQEIRMDGPQTHLVKRGTPTMGGVAIIASTVAGYAAAHLSIAINGGGGPNASGVLLLYLMVGLGVVGFLDDFIKIRNQRSLGLRARAKFLGQLIVGVSFAVLALQFKNGLGLTPASTHLSYVRDIGEIGMGSVGFVLVAYLIVTATSNAVNLTDGLDGLAAGASAMVFGAFTVIALLQFRNPCGTNPIGGCYHVRDPLDIALVAASAMAACFGFLWWNASPAQIFMGDTGSMALGGLMAGLAILTRTELLLVVLGGLFATVTLASVMQYSWFKFTRIRTGTGRRIFRMAPLHHHFELGGWQEVTIIVRFWILAGLAVAFGIGLFYADFIGNG